MIKVKYAIYILPLLIMIWATTFVFVLQPVNGMSSGRTYWMFKPDRLFTEKAIPFFASGDGIQKKYIEGKVNPIGRALITKSVLKNNDLIIKLPYNHITYLLSTGGITYKE